MNCRNCGALLNESDFCSHCGANAAMQKKVYYLSSLYYNQGLEKASIRDLSGAISCLKRSLAFNKMNIQARNLLGLVYFETGEVVAALSEWVISKNLQPMRNIASEYIQKLQSNPNKLDAINETIRKYNIALQHCREGHEDVAAIQLKRILPQNPKLIKGYHLLALIYLKRQEYNKARKILKKAARIDKTNTTTLRFLREVDQQTGVHTSLEQTRKSRNEKEQPEERTSSLIYKAGNDYVIQPPAFKEKSKYGSLMLVGLGIAIGAAVFGFLVMPAMMEKVHTRANQQIVEYSESITSQESQLTQMKGEAQTSKEEAQAAADRIQATEDKAESYAALLAAYEAYNNQELDEAALQIQKVKSAVLSEAQKPVYETICNATGVRGQEQAEEDSSSEEDSQEE